MCRLIKFSNDASQQITTLLYKKRACELNKAHIISTDEDPGLRIESFAVINLRGVSTNKTIIIFCMLRIYFSTCFNFLIFITFLKRQTNFKSMFSVLSVKF